MKNVLALALVGFLAAGFVAAAVPAGAQEYDRYERGTAAPPPPPASPPPAKYRPAPPPPPRPPGFHAGPYLFGNIGIFEPNSYDSYSGYYGTTYGMSGYSSGLSVNGGFGSRLAPFLAVEGTVGYFSAERGSDEASVVPVTVGARFILPNPVFEPYIGAGVGVYFASLNEKPFFYTPTLYYPGTDDSDAAIGGYLSLGMDFWLSPKIALNLDGRYQILQPTFTDKLGGSFDLDMSGWELNVGIRVNF